MKRFVTGHDFSRAASVLNSMWDLTPAELFLITIGEVQSYAIRPF
jgi:hypothetical protein